jgi:hypothetical protein
MKRSLLVLGVAVALVAAWSVGRVQGQKGQAGKVLFASADQANFVARNANVSMAAIWGWRYGSAWHLHQVRAGN